jgi:hypothetical protein
VRYLVLIALVFMASCQVARPAQPSAPPDTSGGCTPIESPTGPALADGCSAELATGVTLTLKRRSLELGTDGASRLYFVVRNRKDVPFLLAMRHNDLAVRDEQGVWLPAALHSADATDTSDFLLPVPPGQEYTFAVRVDSRPDPKTEAWTMTFGTVSRVDNLRWIYRIYE